MGVRVRLTRLDRVSFNTFRGDIFSRRSVNFIACRASGTNTTACRCANCLYRTIGLLLLCRLPPPYGRVTLRNAAILPSVRLTDAQRMVHFTAMVTIEH